MKTRLKKELGSTGGIKNAPIVREVSFLERNMSFNMFLAAGPAEQLTRGSLQPPSQHAPAHRQHLRGAPEAADIPPINF